MCESCLYCSLNKLQLLRNLDGYKVYKCLSCGIAFTCLPKTYRRAKVNKTFYSTNYLKNYVQNSKQMRDRFIQRIKELEEYKSGGRILDIGCSTGLFLKLINKHSKYKWTIYGIDINKYLVDYARKNTEAVILNNSIEECKFPPDYFDCVTCFDVLEHDKEIVNNLTKIRSIIKRNGILMLQVPNYRSLMAYLSGKYWSWWAVPDHVYHFTPVVIQKVLTDQNFVVKKIFTWEPVIDFIKNIKGAIKINIKGSIIDNKLVLISVTLLLFPLWLITVIAEKVIHIGGLTVVIAQKN